MADRTTKDYIGRLTEAQLDGKALPAPSNDDESGARRRFEETDAVFEKVRAVPLDAGWESAVWARIDADGAANDEGREPEGEADASELESTSGGSVIDARGRFGWWPALAGAVAAASVLLAVTFLFQSGGMAPVSVDEPAAMERKQAQAQESTAGPTGGVAEEPAAAVAGGDLMAKNLEHNAPAAVASELAITGFADEGGALAPAQGFLGTARGAGGGEAADDGEGRVARMEPAAASPPADLRPSETVAGMPHRDLAKGDAAGSAGLAFAERPGFGADGKLFDKLEESERTLDADVARLRQQPRLTAGEIDDNAKFGEFQQFLAERSKTHLEPMDVSERLMVRVLDVDNKPVPNAQVSFKAGGQTVFSGRTYANGWMLFHPRTVPVAAAAQQYDVEIRSGQQMLNHTLSRGSREQFQLRLPFARQLPPRAHLDLVFLIDTTSSMADEIERLQATVIQIAEQVSALPSQPQVRFGLVLYRDDTDEYVSQVTPFETDVKRFQATLASVQASGGGDLPERVEVGLHRAVNELSWDDEAVRMVFLVGDAGPHAASQNEYSYRRDIQLAAARGIKVFPVASSGLDDDGEYVFRQLAQFTMARFVFLTYGANGTTTPHAVQPGSFQPETLDRLVVRLVREELAGLETGTP